MTTMLNYFTIEGIASTDSLDSYDEVINQEGLDLSLVDENLVTINIEHGEDFPLFEMAVIGLVTEAKLKDEGLWIKGKIYFDHQYSDNIYQELSKPNSNLQLSIELINCEYGMGKKSGTILNSTLIGVAVTKNPANNDTWARLSKAFNNTQLAGITDDFRQIEESIRNINNRLLKKKTITVKLIKIT